MSDLLIDKHFLLFDKPKAIKEIRVWIRVLSIFMTKRSVHLLYIAIQDIVRHQNPEHFIYTQLEKPYLVLLLLYVFLKTFADSIRISRENFDFIFLESDFNNYVISNPETVSFLKNNVVVDGRVFHDCLRNNVIIISSFAGLEYCVTTHWYLLFVLNELIKRGLVIENEVSVSRLMLDSGIESNVVSLVGLPLVDFKGAEMVSLFPDINPTRQLFQNCFINHSIISLRLIKREHQNLEFFLHYQPPGTQSRPEEPSRFK